LHCDRNFTVSGASVAQLRLDFIPKFDRLKVLQLQSIASPTFLQEICEFPL
jgi:hypothetical protein